MCPMVSEKDPRLEIEDTEYLGETGNIDAYLVKPKGTGKVSGIVVVSEIWGLVPHIKDVARRAAIEGFLTLAPDPLTPLGGTPDNADEARSMMQKLDSQKNTKNFVAAVKYLKTHPRSTGRVGVTGFCWGGGVTNQVAVNSPDVQAAVPFYGMQPKPEDVPKIKAPLLIHYAEDDERINKGIPSFETALKKAGVDYQIHIYKGTQHGFYNDTSPRYHEEAAKLAWKRTVAFFNEKLKT